MTYIDAFSKVLPVILLFILGALLRRTRFLGESTVGDLKKLIVNATLPALLFLALAIDQSTVGGAAMVISRSYLRIG